MKLTPSQSTFVRFAIVATSVAAIDCAYIFLATKPLPGAAIIPCLIPLMTPVVIMPLLKKQQGQ